MSNPETAVVPAQPTAHSPPVPFSVFGGLEAFKDAQRMGLLLCSSTMVPDSYRGEQHLGDCLIALEIANRIGANILAVMQNLYSVHGRPAWSSQFLISCVNASRKFTPLRYRMTGERGQDTWGCIAWAQDRTGENLEGPEVTIAMAKAEGWFNRNGSKWKTMPELMLRYRAATYFTRLYAPELTMGIQTEEEVIDIEATAVPVARRPDFGAGPALLTGPPVGPLPAPPVPGPKRVKQAQVVPPPVTAPAAAQDKPPIATTPPPETPSSPPEDAKEEAAAGLAPAIAPEQPPIADNPADPKNSEAQVAAEVTQPEPAESPVPEQNGATAAPAAPEVEEKLRVTKWDTDLTKQVKMLCLEHGVTFDQMWGWLLKNRVCKPEQKALTELSERSLTALANPRAWAGWKPQMLDPKFKGGR